MSCAIRPLAAHTDLLERIALAYEREWPGWYGHDGPGDAPAYLRAACREHQLPVGLLAFAGGELAGTVVLGHDSAVGSDLPGPWISSLLVFASFRGRGIAATLIDAAEDRARGLGVGAVYIGVTDLEAAMLRRGWRPLRRERHDELDVAILSKPLVGDVPA